MTTHTNQIAAASNVVPIHTNALVHGEIVEAMRNLQTENDRWLLGEALQKEIPVGLNGFDKIVDEAASAGVGVLSANTLRLYRDTAVRWPVDKRVAGMSFSAHREAMVLANIDEARKLLADLKSQLGGADKVTVSAVRKAIAAKTGKVSSAKSAAGTVGDKAREFVLNDLKTGGKELIAAIANSTDPAELDRLHAGLTKVIAHVERLRAKAAVAATKKKATPSKPVAKATVKPAVKKAAAKRGDLRNL